MSLSPKPPKWAAQCTVHCMDMGRMLSSANQKKDFSPNLKIIQPHSAGAVGKRALWEA